MTEITPKVKELLLDLAKELSLDVSSEESVEETISEDSGFPVWAKGKQLGNVPEGTSLYYVKDAEGENTKNVPLVYAKLPDESFKVFSVKNPEGRSLGSQTSDLLSQYIKQGGYSKIEQTKLVDKSDVQFIDVNKVPNC